MLIGQVTDIHLGFDPDRVDEFNRKRLDAALAQLCRPHNRPAMLLATGDLVDRGDADSYRRLKNALSVCPFPVWPALGNHDLRETFAEVFPEHAMTDGFLQYEIDAGALRLLVIDTLEEGRHGGSFCEVRARWLADRLAERRDMPTIIVMHHPPVEVGIPWMNTDPDEPWVQVFADAIAGQPQVKALICGHIHRPVVAPWNGVTVAVCPSTSPQVALDLSPLDPETPDGRAMIIADPPAFALHRWNGRELVSHFETAEDHVMLARFDERMQPLVRSLLSERPGAN